MKRWFFGLGALALVAALVAKGGVKDPAGYPAVTIATGHQTACWPVARTAAQQARGLQHLRQAPYPLVFPFRQPRLAGFWMRDTPSPLTVVWVGITGRVVSRVVMRPGTTRQYLPRSVADFAIEYPHGWPVPAVGTRLVPLGSCGTVTGL